MAMPNHYVGGDIMRYLQLAKSPVFSPWSQKSDTNYDPLMALEKTDHQQPTSQDGRNVLDFKMKPKAPFKTALEAWCDHHGIPQAERQGGELVRIG